MSPFDIIRVPWQPEVWLRRVIVDALDRAGRPHINSGGRLKPEQQRLYDKYLRGEGAPADNPNSAKLPLAHVRFVAADIDPTPVLIRELTRQGLVRPYDYEPWHWQVHNVWDYPLVIELPGGNLTMATEKELKDWTTLTVRYEQRRALGLELDTSDTFFEALTRELDDRRNKDRAWAREMVRQELDKREK